MQNYAQSGLLQNYIAQNAGATRQAPISASTAEQQPSVDEFAPARKKAKIAKNALLSAAALTAATAFIAAYRHNGGVFEKIGGEIKGFFDSNGKKVGGAVKEGVSGLAEYQNGATNFTNAKDAVTRHFLSKIPGYERFDAWAANVYKSACKNTVAKKYQTALSAFENAKNGVGEAVKNGSLDEASGKRLAELIGKKQTAASTFAQGFKERFGKVDGQMSALDKTAFKKLKNMTGKGVEGIKSFTKKSIVDDKLKEIKGVQERSMKIGNSGLTVAETKELDKLLGKIKDKNLSKAIEKADKAFKKAYSKEANDMFYKLRDINCGSASTDIISAATTAGLLGIYIAQADSKEEKTGVTLTTGIPLGVMLTTTIGATVKMVSGAKALGLGLLTGFIANKIGKKINNKYQETHDINPKKTIVTIDDYTESARSKLFEYIE